MTSVQSTPVLWCGPLSSGTFKADEDLPLPSLGVGREAEGPRRIVKSWEKSNQLFKGLGAGAL